MYHIYLQASSYQSQHQKKMSPKNWFSASQVARTQRAAPNDFRPNRMIKARGKRGARRGNEPVFSSAWRCEFPWNFIGLMGTRTVTETNCYGTKKGMIWI